MSVLEILGSIGIGAVIGWFIGILEPRRSLFRQLLAILFASSAVLLEIALMLGWQAALISLGSGLFTLWIHKLWRKQLRERHI